jgi:putative lysine transport system permease protein
MFIISFTEFFSVHRTAVGATYLYFPSAVIEMAGYLTMTLAASFILRWVEKRMDGPANFDLALADHLTMTSGTYRHPGHKKGHGIIDRNLQSKGGER